MKGLKDKRGKFIRNIKDKECLACKKIFRPRLEKQKYCCLKCATNSRIKDHTRICGYCKKEFIGRKERNFCSSKCYGKSGIGVKIGKDNILWRGGISKLNVQIRSCFKYRQWRSDVFTRDDFICQECYKKGVRLDAHHIKTFSKILEEYNIKTLNDALNCEELWNINNGQTLCVICHKNTKTYLKRKK